MKGRFTRCMKHSYQLYLTVTTPGLHLGIICLEAMNGTSFTASIEGILPRTKHVQRREEATSLVLP